MASTELARANDGSAAEQIALEQFTYFRVNGHAPGDVIISLGGEVPPHGADWDSAFEAIYIRALGGVGLGR